MSFSESSGSFFTALSKVFPLCVCLNGLLFFFFRNSFSPGTDFVSCYSPLAVHLLQGKGYVAEGVFFTHFPPLFPFMLALCYRISGIWGIQNLIYPVTVLFLQGFSCAVFYWGVCEMAGRRIALISACLLATYPFFMVLSVTRYAWNSTPLFLFFFINSTVIFFHGVNRKERAFLFLSGLLQGLAALTWPGATYAPILFIIYMICFLFKEKRNVLLAGLFLAGFLLPTGSWSVYVHSQTGKKVFVSSAASASMIDGLVRHEGSKLRGYSTVQRAKTLREDGKIQTSRDVLHFYQEEIKEFPSDFVRWAVYKLSRAWYGTDSEKHERFNLLIQTPYILFGCYGVLLLIRERKKEAWLLLGLIFYFWGVSFSVLTTIRYMMPAFMLWMLFAGYGVDHFLRKCVR